MNYLGIFALLIVVAIGAWWGGKNIQKIQDENGEPGVYQDAIDSAREAALQVGNAPKTDAELADTITAPVTNDPQTGRSIFVYDDISVSEGTTILNLTGRGLTGSLKAEVRFLTNLKELNLSNNLLTGVPAEIGQLSELEVLNLSNNPITGLPYELANLKNLKVLDLRGTQYAKQDLEVIKKGLSSDTQILVN